MSNASPSKRNTAKANRKQENQVLSPKSYYRGLYYNDDSPPTSQSGADGNKNVTTKNGQKKQNQSAHNEDSFAVPSQQLTPKDSARKSNGAANRAISSDRIKAPVPVKAHEQNNNNPNHRTRNEPEKGDRPARRPPPVPGTIASTDSTPYHRNPSNNNSYRSSPQHRDEANTPSQKMDAMEKLVSPSPSSKQNDNVTTQKQSSPVPPPKQQQQQHHHRATSRRSSVSSSTLGNTALSRLIAEYSSTSPQKNREKSSNNNGKEKSRPSSQSPSRGTGRHSQLTAPPIPPRHMSPVEQLIELLQETRDLINNPPPPPTISLASASTPHTAKSKGRHANDNTSRPPHLLVLPTRDLQPHIVEGKLLSIVVLADLVEKDVMAKHDLRQEEKLAWLLNECGVILGQCGPFCTNSQIRWKSQEVEFYQKAQEHYERIYGSEKRDAVNWAVCIMNLGSSIIELREEDQNERKLEQERRIFFAAGNNLHTLQQHRSISTRSNNNNNNIAVENDNHNSSSGVVTRSTSVEDTEQDVKVLQQGLNIMQYSLAMHRRLYNQYLYERDQHDRHLTSLSNPSNNNNNNNNQSSSIPPILAANNEKELAACLRELGQTLSRLGLFAEAVKLLEQHLQMVMYFAARAHKQEQENQNNNNNNNNDNTRQQHLPEDEDVAAAQNQIGYCLCEAREYRRGIEYQLGAIENYQNIAQGEDNSDLCTLKMNCGYYLCEDGRPDDGIRMMRSGIDMKRRILRDDAEYQKYLIRKQQMKDAGTWKNSNDDHKRQQTVENGDSTYATRAQTSRDSSMTPGDNSSALSLSATTSTVATSLASHSSLHQDYLALARRQIEKLRPSETFAVMLWNCGLQYEKLQDPNYLNDALEMHAQALAMFRRVYPRPCDEHEWIIRATDKVGKLMQAKAALIKERMYQSQHFSGGNNNSPSNRVFYYYNNNGDGNSNDNRNNNYVAGLHPSPHHQSNQQQHVRNYHPRSNNNSGQKLEFSEY